MQEKVTGVVGKEQEAQHIPVRLQPCSPPLPRPTEKNEAESIHLTSGPVSIVPSTSASASRTGVCLCEGWELCHQEPTGESACYSCRDRKPCSEAPPNPRPGPAPNVTIWGWGPHPLPLREDVKVKMSKSREKVKHNQAGAQSVTALLIG